MISLFDLLWSILLYMAMTVSYNLHILFPLTYKELCKHKSFLWWAYSRRALPYRLVHLCVPCRDNIGTCMRQYSDWHSVFVFRNSSNCLSWEKSAYLTEFSSVQMEKCHNDTLKEATAILLWTSQFPIPSQQTFHLMWCSTISEVATALLNKPKVRCLM